MILCFVSKIFRYFIGLLTFRNYVTSSGFSFGFEPGHFYFTIHTLCSYFHRHQKWHKTLLNKTRLAVITGFLSLSLRILKFICNLLDFCLFFYTKEACLLSLLNLKIREHERKSLRTLSPLKSDSMNGTNKQNKENISAYTISLMLALFYFIFLV